MFLAALVVWSSYQSRLLLNKFNTEEEEEKFRAFVASYLEITPAEVTTYLTWNMVIWALVILPAGYLVHKKNKIGYYILAGWLLFWSGFVSGLMPVLMKL